MAITENPLTSGGDDTNLSSYTTASVTPTANRLVLLAILNSKATTPDAVNSVTGNSLTWVSVGTVTFNTIASPTKRVSVFRTMGASPTTGTITIDFNGVTQTGCTWSLAEFAGIDTSGTNGSGAVGNTATNNGNGVGSLTVTLAAFGSANNGTYGAFGVGAAKAVSPGTGFSEIHDVSGTAPNRELETEWLASNDTTVDASLTAGGTDDLGGVALEIVAAAAGWGPLLDFRRNALVVAT